MSFNLQQTIDDSLKRPAGTIPNHIPVTGNEPGGMMRPTGAVQTMMPPTVSQPTSTTPQPTSVSPTPGVAPAPAPTGATSIGDTNISGQLNMDVFNQMKAQAAGQGAEPTVGQTLAGVGDGLSPYQSFEDIYGKEPNEQDIMSNQLRLFQGEIDATNQIYDQMLNQARLEGQGRLGSQRAMGARGGILGSDFAASQKNEVQNFNTGINRGIQAERAAAIGAIMGNVRSAVVDQMREKREARQQGAENYLDWLGRSHERKQQNAGLIAQDLLLQGIDPSTLNENELASIAKEAGVSVQDVMRQYQMGRQQQEAAQAEAEIDARERGMKEMKTEAEIRKIEADIARGAVITLPEGNMMLNLETGETFKNPKTYAPSSGGGGGAGGSANFTATQRNKLEAAGLLNSSREQQLQYLFGPNQDLDIEGFMNENRNADEETLRQELLSAGLSPGLVNSHLKTRPVSDPDAYDVAYSWLSDKIQPRLWQSRPKELEIAKKEALKELDEDYNRGRTFNIFGRSKQLTDEDYHLVKQQISNFSGREDANQLIESK